MDFKELMMLKSRRSGFFYEYKKNRPRIVRSKEPEKKRDFDEILREELDRQAEEKRLMEERRQKAKEEFER